MEKMKYGSLLFVPAKENMLRKISEFNAGAYVIDLEDSIKENDKDEALDVVCNFLEMNSTYLNIYIRVNANRLLKELGRIKAYSNVGIMLPKFEVPEEYYQFEEYLSRRKVIALVETPKGIINAPQIAECPWVDSLAFGAEDFTTALGMKNDFHLLGYAKCALLVAAKANCKSVFDTPSFQISDIKKFETEVQNAVDMGFDGKLAIHPKQIECINKLFCIMDIGRMKEIICAYENAESAVVVIDDRIYEKMHIERMKKLVCEMEE